MRRHRDSYACCMMACAKSRFLLEPLRQRTRPLTGTHICQFPDHSPFPTTRRIGGKEHGCIAQSNRPEIYDFSVKSAFFQLAGSLVNKFQPITHKNVGTAVFSSLLNECTYPQHICAYFVQTASRFSALSLEQPPDTSNTLEHTENRTTQRHDRVSVKSLNTSFHTLFHFVSCVLSSINPPRRFTLRVQVHHHYKSRLVPLPSLHRFIAHISALSSRVRLFSSRGTVLPLP